ncbi:RelA/SpoT domain-containing protein [Coleofasciculus sp. FACHB-T130]|uniref:RelA/SpoT domain-containing protein n=1 Tax=Cyanophyceae TaxID=3028117 RepID=UPI00168753AC|nr:RelA/SpoT domain-containing protein [Coleofasciculus sp. FACHB-T130]MBD1878360.1 RelA/SpoT domain-containing protein [Coleofasciculus sp. FACHB-T130]
MDYDDKILASADLDDDAMAWTELQYSKTEVGKAGDTLINPSSTKEECSQALLILNNWRASHAFPLNSLQGSLRYRCNLITPEALVSQRLKRVSSITNKLSRFSGMKLNRMQDIGGCRAVMPTVENVYQLQRLMVDKATTVNGKLIKIVKSNLIKEYDYIKNPKPSGYRGIHLIYKYQSKRRESFNGHVVEIQMRSLIQHAWATSVEIAGAFLGDALKSGQGSEEWLKFFGLISILFSQFEECTPEEISTTEIENIRQETIYLANKLSVSEKLKAFSVATKYGNEHGEAGYFLLVLNVDEKTISINYYNSENLENANNEYLELEEKYKNTNINIVLVATESMWSLRKAFPNYFADSELFLETLNKVLYQ